MERKSMKQTSQVLLDLQQSAMNPIIEGKSPRVIGELVGRLLSAVPTKPDLMWLGKANICAIYVNALKRSGYKSFVVGFKRSASFPDIILDDVNDEYTISAIKNTLFKCVNDVAAMSLYHDNTTRYISSSCMAAQDLVAAMNSRYIKYGCSDHRIKMLIDLVVRNIDYLNNAIPGQFSNKRSRIRNLAISGMTVDDDIAKLDTALCIMYEYSVLSNTNDCPLGYNHNYGIYTALSNMHTTIEVYRDLGMYSAATLLIIVAYHNYLRSKNAENSAPLMYDPPKQIYDLCYHYGQDSPQKSGELLANFNGYWSLRSMLNALCMNNELNKDQWSIDDISEIIDLLINYHKRSTKIKKGGNKNV